MSDVQNRTAAVADSDLFVARDRLEAHASSFAGALASGCAAWTRRIEDGTLPDLASCLRQAADAHGRLRDRLPPEIASNRTEVWVGLRQYTEDCATQVWGPVAQMLQERHPVRAVGEASAEALSFLASTARDLPGNTVVPEPEDLLHPDPADPVALSASKAARRAVRRVRAAALRLANTLRRVTGRPARSLPGPTRSVHLARHALALCHGSLRSAIGDAERAVSSRLRKTLGAVGDVAETWADVLLPALDEADSHAWHGANHFGAAAVDHTGGDPWIPAVQRAVEIAAQTAHALDAIAAEAAAISVPTPDTDPAAGLLARAVDIGGTFVLPDPVPPDIAPTPVGVVDPKDDRVRFTAELTRFRTTLDRMLTDVLHTLGDGTLVPLAQAQGALRDRLTAIQVDALRHLDADTDPEALRGVQSEAVRSVERAVRDIPQPERAEKAFRKSSAGAWTDLTDALAALPERLLLPAPVRRAFQLTSIPLREIAQNAVSTDFAPKILSLEAVLNRDLVRVWNDSEYVVHVVDAAFSAAAQELESAGPDARATARRLVEDGLRRAAESVDDSWASLASPWRSMVENLHTFVLAEWRLLYRSLGAEDVLQQRWFGLRARGIQGTRALVSALRRATSGILDRSLLLARTLRMRLSRVVRLGKAAVGASDAPSDERLRTIDAIAGAETLYGAIPLIYRKLFTLDALTEPGLTVHRTEDTVAAVTAHERWRMDRASGVLVVHAPRGAGRTTYLGLVERALPAGTRVRRLTLADRVEDERALAELVAPALRPDRPAPSSLQDLETWLQDDPPEETVVLLDDLEQALLQAPGGTRLLESLLLFFARTDARIFWCVAVNDLAWRFLERTSPAAAGVADTLGLRPWDRRSLQNMVLERHRRTGVVVRFGVPESPSPLLRQRLRRARTPEAVQQLLRDEFFDGLARSAGQDPATALHGWVRSAQFDSDDDVLTVSPFRPLSFSFLNHVDNERAFILRALLIHRTLTVHHLDRLFRSTTERTIANLETLLALGLIESTTSHAPDSYILPDEAYRVKRLVLQPVRRFLSGRNFVH